MSGVGSPADLFAVLVFHAPTFDRLVAEDDREAVERGHDKTSCQTLSKHVEAFFFPQSAESLVDRI